ncbi:Pseudouridine-5'-phosphatase [Gracilariopsis chorda]|uniref:Pseudouridine-5'-phosphatase n=1 Tax=Gracilariopsis chorda TaxID=448386 RepID=A0A2V3ILR1_9FLOR|nr:Pseudouridine-5'-phosphatase [Gracilariopsis chorda]|eukprot:PXF42060.1 Pseudouridine-5'-phosphatase [Gracilariopsis chorda]
MNSVIWDMDGVLLDSEPIYERVEQAVVSQYGKNIAPIIPQLLGRTAPTCAQITVQQLNLPITPAQYLAQRNAQLLVEMKKVHFLPGVQRTVRHLRQQGVKQAIATSSPRDLLIAKQHGKQHFFHLFDALVCGDDVTHGKPDPQIFLSAARAIGEAPSNCVVFEDAPAGCKAARLAGMKCVALPSHHADIKLYQDEDPLLIVPSACLLDVDLSLLGFPPLPKLDTAE